MFAQRAAARAAKPVAAARSLATVSSLGKRTTLANVQSDSSTSSLTLVLKAGSRFEPTQGAAAVLKNSAFKSNAASSALAIARGTEQLGGALSATLTREHLLLTADFLPGDEEFFLKTLHAALFPKFLAHEHNEQIKPLVAQETDAALRSPAVSALELSHKVAFRKGLGNSLFASAAEPVASSDVQAFYRSAFSQEIGLIGQGVDTATLEGHAGDLFGEELDIQLENRKVPFNAKQAADKTTYHGGEERVAIDLHLLPEAKPTFVLSYGLTKAASAESLVLPHLLGTAPAVKWSAGSSPLGRAAAATEGSTASAILSSYSDAQLLSIEVQAEGSKRLSETGKAVVAAVHELASAKLSDEQVKGAVARAKFEAAANAEYTSSVAHTVAQQLLTGKSASLADTFKALDAVTPESLAKALKEFTSAKPTVVSIARLGQMAYADELGLKM